MTWGELMTSTDKKSRRAAKGMKGYTLEFSEADLEALRNFVHWTPGATIAGCVRQAIRAFLDDAESKLRVIHKNDGEVFTKQPGEPYPDRPVNEWRARGGRPPG